MKYRKRETVDAVQWFTQKDFPDSWFYPDGYYVIDLKREYHRAAEAVKPGDWIISKSGNTRR